MIKKQLKVLVRSQISVIHHTLMVGPKLLEKQEEFRRLLVNMTADAKGKGVIESLGFTGWETVDDEEMEFNIDLMETLQM